ncbi:MAG TPA: MTH938/NDUFAF3 family protein [Actinomycetota bacterium]
MASLTGFRFGRIVLDGEEVSGDLIVLPGRVVRNWWRLDGHALVLDDLSDVLDELPGHLVVGTGHDGRMRPDPETLEALRERGIQVDVLPTTEAVRRYGELDPNGSAAALHLTC